MPEPPKMTTTPEAKPAAPKPRFTARLRYARVSPRKMRYVVDLVRGKDYNSALGILRVCAKRGAPFCKKLLESAYENAMDIARGRDLDIDGNKLHLVEARVDGGTIIKRWRPSSARRPYMIKKRTCHVTFVLEERDLKEPKRERARRRQRERQQADQSKKAAAKAEKAQAKAAEKKEAPRQSSGQAPQPKPAEGGKSES